MLFPPLPVFAQEHRHLPLVGAVPQRSLPACVRSGGGVAGVVVARLQELLQEHEHGSALLRRERRAVGEREQLALVERGDKLDVTGVVTELLHAHGVVGEVTEGRRRLHLTGRPLGHVSEGGVSVQCTRRSGHCRPQRKHRHCHSRHPRAPNTRRPNVLQNFCQRHCVVCVSSKYHDTDVAAFAAELTSDTRSTALILAGAQRACLAVDIARAPPPTGDRRPRAPAPSTSASASSTPRIVSRLPPDTSACVADTCYADEWLRADHVQETAHVSGN